MQKVSLSTTEAFRTQTAGKRYSLPIDNREKLIIGIMIIQLIIVSWAFGGNIISVQYMTLGLSLLGVLCLFIPFSRNNYAYSFYSLYHPKTNATRLIKFPVFWLGLALMIYMAIQGWNPSDEYIFVAGIRLIETLSYIEWLPSGMDAPIKEMNSWRMMIMSGSVWLTICMFWTGVHRRRSVMFLFWAVTINMTLIAVVSILHNLDYPREMLWLFKRPPQDIFGPFLYINHAAAYLNIGLILLLALFLHYFKHGLQRGLKSNPQILLSMMGLFVFGAIFISLSRGGILIASILMIIFITLTTIIIIRFGSGLYLYSFSFIMLFIALCLSALFYTTIDKKRFIKDFEDLNFSLKSIKEDYRYNLNQATVEMIEDRWLLGWGAGSYRYYFPRYQKENLVLWEKIEGARPFLKYAHNDWLQYLAELGLVGFSLILLTLVYWAFKFIKAYKQMSFMHYMVSLGSLLLLFYAWIDFPFYNLAVMITFSVLVVGTAKLLALRKSIGLRSCLKSSKN